MVEGWEQKALVEELTTKVESSNNINSNLQREIYHIKTLEAEKLSHNLMLSGPLVSSVVASENPKQAAITLIKDHTKYPLHLHEAQVISAERYGRKPPGQGPDTRGILVKFRSKETKKNIVINNLKNRTEGFYVNEQLIPDVNDLYRETRKLKKEHPSKIATLHTYDGIIRVKKKDEGKQYNILTKADLRNFKMDIGLPNDD